MLSDNVTMLARAVKIFFFCSGAQNGHPRVSQTPQDWLQTTDFFLDLYRYRPPLFRNTFEIFGFLLSFKQLYLFLQAVSEEKSRGKNEYLGEIRKNFPRRGRKREGRERVFVRISCGNIPRRARISNVHPPEVQNAIFEHPPEGLRYHRASTGGPKRYILALFGDTFGHSSKIDT